jgi:ABC-type branched-subunit amino acid transport system substrate-binding protein
LKKGVEIAVSEINAKGGVKGRLLEIIYEDGKCSNKEASTANQKLISIDKVKGSNPNK